MRLERTLRQGLAVAALLGLLGVARGQNAGRATNSPSMDVANTPREASHLLAQQLKASLGPEINGQVVTWVVAIDISGSGAGFWLQSVRKVLEDFVDHLMVPEDRLIWLPFDSETDPRLDMEAQGKTIQRTFPATGGQTLDRVAAKNSLRYLLEPRRSRSGGYVQGTLVDQALSQTVARTAIESKNDSRRRAVLLLFTDTAVDDAKERSLFETTAGMHRPGLAIAANAPDAMPFERVLVNHRDDSEPRSPKEARIYVFASVADSKGALTSRAVREVPPIGKRRRERPTAAYLLGLLLLGGGAALGIMGVAARRWLYVYWGERGQPRMLGVGAPNLQVRAVLPDDQPEPCADAWDVWADGLRVERDKRYVQQNPTVATVELTNAGAVCRALSPYAFVDSAAIDPSGAVVAARDGAGGQELLFQLISGSQGAEVNRTPGLLRIASAHPAWQTRLSVGIVLLIVGLSLFCVPSREVVEKFCGR